MRPNLEVLDRAIELGVKPWPQDQATDDHIFAAYAENCIEAVAHDEVANDPYRYQEERDDAEARRMAAVWGANAHTTVRRVM